MHILIFMAIGPLLLVAVHTLPLANEDDGKGPNNQTGLWGCSACKLDFCALCAEKMSWLV